jgi:hypothetical protein
MIGVNAGAVAAAGMVCKDMNLDSCCRRTSTWARLLDVQEVY